MQALRTAAAAALVLCACASASAPMRRAALAPSVRASAVDPSDPSTYPVQQYYEYFLTGQCDKMAAMVTEDFVYWSNNQNASLPPYQINATKMHGICMSQGGKNFHSPCRNGATMGPLWSSCHYGSREIAPSRAAGGTANCTVPQDSFAEAVLDPATGKIRILRQVVKQHLWLAGAELCFKGTPLPTPSAHKGAMPPADFATAWLNLLWAGQCDAFASLFAANFTMVDGVQSAAADGAAAKAHCEVMWADKQFWLVPDSAINDLGATTVISGLASMFVKDPDTCAPCGTFFDMSARVHTVVDSAGDLRVDHLELALDEAALLKDMAATCHWQPTRTARESGRCAL